MKDNISIGKSKYVNNTKLKSVMWNAAGSLFNAASSMQLLIIVTRLNGNFEGGIFAFAFSVSQLFYTIGSFEMRPYQSTDINEKYKFSEYFQSRVLTCIFMIAVTVVYICMFGYSGEKGWLIFWLCLYRMTDAFSDVFQGYFQVKDRLDLSGKSLTLRVVISTAIFFISMIITKDIIKSSICMVLSCIVWIIIFDINMYHHFAKMNDLFKRTEIKRMKGLFCECMPLFLGSFLLMYIFNIPKYAIDKFMESDIQNYFNILFMPVSIINLFSIFLFRPVLTSLSEYYNKFQYNKFVYSVGKLIIWIVFITAFFLAGSYFLGIPVLSVIYNTNLKIYKSELLIMMAGGGFSAISTLLHYVITVMRKQKSLLVGYIVCAVTGKVISDSFILSFGIMGAAYIYLLLMIILSIIFGCTLCYYIIRDKYNNKQVGNYNG